MNEYWLWDRQMQSCLGIFSVKKDAEDYADKHFVENWREWIEVREVASTEEAKRWRDYSKT